MKKSIALLAAVLMAVSLLCTAAFAEPYTGEADWYVTFTADKRMESNFHNSVLDEAIAGMQPGDDIVFTLELTSEYEEPVNWYMLNGVLYSLEDRSRNAATAGGAYTYELVYIDPEGTENVLYSSETVGGEEVSAAGEGLHEATDALDEFFFLDNLGPGDKGHIILTVSLDGETQGNDYQDTLADLQMRFMVDIETINTPYDPEDPEDPYNPENPDSPYNPTPPPDKPNNPSNPPRTTTPTIKTGDTQHPLRYAILLGANGILFVGLGIYTVMLRRKEKKGENA